MNLERFKNKPFYLTDEDLNWVKTTYETLDLDEKIGQLFFLTAYRDDDAFFEELVNHHSFGGLMFRSLPAENVVRGIDIVQSHAKVPVLVSANLESGANGLAETGTQIGSQMMIAATDDARYAYLLAKHSLRETKPMGLNFTFSPVVDIDFNFRNPITNTRTFGSDPDRVLTMASSYIRACREENVAAAIKHFPGDGVDERDQHLVTTINSLSCEEWDATYGRIYQALIEEGVKSVMVGHICLPAYQKKLNPELRDEELMPATLSKELMQGLLRQKLGFNGLIITDATTMAGLNMAMSRDALVPNCIQAGADMFLFTRNLEEDYRYMKEGYQKGILTPERLEEAVCTILAFKASLGLHKRDNRPVTEEALRGIGDAAHLQTAWEVADRSITLVKQQEGVLPLSAGRCKRILLHMIDSGENALGYDRASNDEFAELLRNEGFTVDIYDPGTNRYEGMLKPYRDTVDQYDLIIYICSVATKSNQTTVRIEWINPMGMNVPVYTQDIPTIFISTENPYHMLDVPRIPTFINTYGKNKYTLERLVEKLMGRSSFTGKSPVDPFCGLKQAKYTFFDWRETWKK